MKMGEEQGGRRKSEKEAKQLDVSNKISLYTEALI